MPARFLTNKTPMVRETLTVSNVVLPLTRTVYETTPRSGAQHGSRAVRASGAIISVDSVGATTGIRYTRDGTTPVALTTGAIAANSGTAVLPAGPYQITIEGWNELVQFKMIKDQATDTQIEVEYFR